MKRSELTAVLTLLQARRDASEKLDRIREAVEGLGSLPTLTKLRAFIESLKVILNERSGE